MKTVNINSMRHYAFREGLENQVLLLEFPDDCPGMGHREEYSDDEGIVIHSFWIGEEVKFDYGRGRTLRPWASRDKTCQGARFRCKIGAPLADGKIHCGDDLRYILSAFVKQQPGAWEKW